jgi:hypothetical protein
MFHQHNNSNHLDKTNAYGFPMIYCDIVPKNLNNIEQKFHLQMCKGWSLLCIWMLWFFIVQNIELQNWVGNVQYAINHQHKYFPSTPSHLEIPNVATYWN